MGESRTRSAAGEVDQGDLQRRRIERVRDDLDREPWYAEVVAYAERITLTHARFEEWLRTRLMSERALPPAGDVL